MQKQYSKITHRKPHLASSLRPKHLIRFSKQRLHTIPRRKKVLGTINNKPFSMSQGTLSTLTEPNDFFSRETKGVFENRLLPEGLGAQASPGELRGFTPHGHRGLATFTMIKKGFVEHRDSKGHRGVIGPGDVQYLRTARGIVHSEMPHFPEGHGDGPIHIEGIQLWFNLPRALKLAEPQYQDVSKDKIPVVTKGNTTANVIMGTAMGVNSPIKTDTPAHYINYILGPNEVIEHQMPAHWNSFVYVMEGAISEAGSNKTPVPIYHTVFFEEGMDAAQSAMAAASVCEEEFDFKRNQGVRIKAGPEGAEFILLSAEPLDPSEGVFQRGPFVLNSRDELEAAEDDLANSKNGFEGAQDWIKNWKP